MTDKELVELLIEAMTAPDFESVYNERWDTWLISNGHIDKFVLMMMKSTRQYDVIVEEAKSRADLLKTSPLWKALK